MRVQHGGRFEKVEVTANGKGLASHAGAGLLVAVADKVGLTDAPCEALSVTRESRSAHNPGEVVRDVCSGRRTRLRLERPWPWAQALVAAFERIKALPAPAPP